MATRRRANHLGLINPFGIDRATLVSHRALSDAIVTAAIFFELAKHATWPQIVQWSYEPTLLTYLRFGMHRGERFDAAPEDYLRWIAEGNHDLSEDVRFSARYWLDRRGQPALAGGERYPRPPCRGPGDTH